MAKKIVKKNKAAKPKKALIKTKAAKSSRKSLNKTKSQRIKRISIVATDVVVENAKFFSPQAKVQPVKKVLSQELPGKYGRDEITLMVRDPSWLYTWWEVADSTVARFEAEFKSDFWLAKKVLRIYDVTSVDFNGSNAYRYFDVEVGTFVGNWYVETAPGRLWCVDIGLLFPDGRFVTILRSNIVGTPLDGPSTVTDEEWMIPDYMFARLYGMGFGFGKSSPVGRGWQERFKHILSSGVSSGASGIRRKK
jgi:hypothetical protein